MGPVTLPAFTACANGNARSPVNGPRWKRFAAEAWRRADAGELADEELYCCHAQWSGLYDRMFPHTAEEIERRLALAADYGDGFAE